MGDGVEGQESRAGLDCAELGGLYEDSENDDITNLLWHRFHRGLSQFPQGEDPVGLTVRVFQAIRLAVRARALLV